MTREENAIKLAHPDCLLNSLGWFESFESRMSVNKEMKPVPWYTYAATSFIEPRLSRDMHILEFGSGHSTLWYSERVHYIESVEHSKEWYEKMSVVKTSIGNIKWFLLSVDEYDKHGLRYKDCSPEFDIICIDGIKRPECIKNSLYALKNEGVVIWDNSNRKIDNEGYGFLKNNGFRRIDFWGMGPVNLYGWETSVFYRSGNCFNI